MAIYLKVEDYCQGCNKFEVDVLQYQKGLSCDIDTHILCKHKEKCKAIEDFLKVRYESRERFYL